VAGDGSRNLPLVYRDDVVDALLLAERADNALGHVINVVDTTAITQNDYLLAAGRKQALRIQRMPTWVLAVLAWKIEILGKMMNRDVPLSRYKIRSLKPLWPFETAKARDVLGWSPRVGTAEGLRRTFGDS